MNIFYLIVKILSPIAVFLFGLLHKKICRFLVQILIIILAIIVIYIDYDEDINNKKRSNEEFKTVSTELKTVSTELETVSTNLDSIKRMIEPIIEFTDANYPDINTENAIIKLAEKLKKLEDYSKRKNYKPLSRNIKNDLVENLRTIKPIVDKKYEGHQLKISFCTLDGNRNTDKICRDMQEMFIKAGYKVTESSNKGRSLVIDNNLKAYSIPVFIVNPKYKEIRLSICAIFRRYITNLKYVTDEDYNESTFNFQFYGIPEFSENGVVTYPK